MERPVMTFRVSANKLPLPSLALLCALTGALALSACTSGPPQARVGKLAPPPATLPAAKAGAADALLGGKGGFTVQSPDVSWGRGVLRPSGLEHVDLPLFAAPKASHWGWITQGRVYDLLAQKALPDRSASLLETSGGRAFLVLDEAKGGWVQIRYGTPADRGGGLAWTNPELARGGSATYIPWTRALEDVHGLIFRNPGVKHNLRADPADDSSVVARLDTGKFDMEALEIRGDWMRVRVNWPPECLKSAAESKLLGRAEKRTSTGWITWRSDARGPWVAPAPGSSCQGGA
jgi:hypothetical protein